MNISVNAIGSLAASNAAVVRAQVGGVVRSLHFSEGLWVQAGQLLAQLDPRAFQATLAQAEGVLARDQAQLQGARTDLARDAIAKQQLDTQATLVAQLEGTVQAAQDAVDNARLQLSYTRVTAATAPVPDAWWTTLFQDPVLDRLESRLPIGNETLKSAVAAVNSARNPADSVSLSANASWEIDLWGRLAQASRDDLAAARLSAQALLAQTCFALRTASAQEALLARTIAAYQQSLALTQARHEGGVADAGVFPDLVLSASAGFRGAGLAKLVSGPGLLWSAGASPAQTVLTALQEVEDKLVLANQLPREAELQQETLHSAQQNLQIVQDQYRAGTVGYLNVVAAQTSTLSAESALLAARNRQLAAVNTLLKNIAGRWDRPQP